MRTLALILLLTGCVGVDRPPGEEGIEENMEDSGVTCGLGTVEYEGECRVDEAWWNGGDAGTTEQFQDASADLPQHDADAGQDAPTCTQTSCDDDNDCTSEECTDRGCIYRAIPDCPDEPPGSEETCAPMEDGDEDGLVWCADRDCFGPDHGCDNERDAGSGGSCEVQDGDCLCNDSRDNDWDGLVDCYDPDCFNTERCEDFPY